VPSPPAPMTRSTFSATACLVVALELRDLRLQLRHPGAGLQTLEDQANLLAARQCATSMTSRPQTQGGDRSETQERSRALKLSQ